MLDRLPPSGKAQPKTYYFSVDDGLSREIRASCELQQVDHGHTRLQGTDSTNLIANGHNRTDDVSFFCFRLFQRGLRLKQPKLNYPLSKLVIAKRRLTVLMAFIFLVSE